MSAVDITVERVNASFIRLYTDDEGIRKTIHDHFTYHEPGFVKNKWSKWDGVVRMFKLRGNLLPYGCLMMLMELSKTNGWKLEMDEAFRNDVSSVTRAELKEWVATLDLRSGGHVIDPYDYQLESLYLSIKYNRIVILAATSAGKSLIIYLLARYYEMLHDQDGKKTLIIVPSQMLVDQLFQDFKDYSTVNGWDVEATVHTIMQGRPKTSRKTIFISTWQSIFEEDAEYFSVFGRLVNDECFHPDTRILTPNGWNEIKNLNPGDMVINFDENTRQYKEDIIIKVHKNLMKSSEEKFYELSFDNRATIKVTGNHKFLTKNRGWVRADNLTEDDEIESYE